MKNPFIWENGICFYKRKKYSFCDNKYSVNPLQVRELLYNTYNYKCFYTGEKITKISLLDIDHIIPKSFDGPDHLFNLVPTTKRFNRKTRNDIDHKKISVSLKKAKRTIESVEKDRGSDLYHFLKEREDCLAYLKTRRRVIKKALQKTKINPKTKKRLAEFFRCSLGAISCDIKHFKHVDWYKNGMRLIG